MRPADRAARDSSKWCTMQWLWRAARGTHARAHARRRLLEEAMDRIIKDGSKSQAEKDEAKKVSAQV